MQRRLYDGFVFYDKQLRSSSGAGSGHSIAFVPQMGHGPWSNQGTQCTSALAQLAIQQVQILACCMVRSGIDHTKYLKL